LKKASLGVSCSACCSTIVAADAAIEGVANAGAALKLAAVWIFAIALCDSRRICEMSFRISMTDRAFPEDGMKQGTDTVQSR
jgi:hypothetical protein